MIQALTGFFSSFLCRAPVHFQRPYRGGDVTGVFGQHTLDVHPLERRQGGRVVHRGRGSRNRRSSGGAEPDDTGGKFVHLSPGDKTQLYGFVQLPVYQDVNGVQLTVDWAVVAGLSRRF